MYKRFVWPVLIVITIVLTFAFVYGFAAAISITSSQENNDSESTQKPTDDIIQMENSQSEKNDSKYSVLLVLGDSIGAGIGDDKGEGIGEKYADLVLQNSNQSIEIINMSVAGSKTHDLLTLIDKSDLKSTIEAAELIFVSIGGNDLKNILNEESISILIDFEELLIQYIQDISKIFKTIDEQNPNAKIIVLGLYNPYGEDISQQTIKLLLQWNYETQNLISFYPNIVYTPSYDLFQNHLDSYLAIDNFHPNTKGYQMIARRIYEVIHGSN